MPNISPESFAGSSVAIERGSNSCTNDWAKAWFAITSPKFSGLVANSFNAMTFFASLTLISSSLLPKFFAESFL